MSREYPARPIVGIGVAVLRPAPGVPEVLLVRRAKAPNPGSWALPGGAQELGETAADAARREILEECGLVLGELHLAANVDSIHRDPDGRVRYQYTIIDFAALWQGDAAVAGDDVSELLWARVDALEGYCLWSEALRVIAIARRLLAI
ncbi:MAG: NUDIX hydrolase [Acetobacteraceae bacterium]|nr:NUDIX hydrolase [Acetobacteraceae bacterium]